MMRGIQPEEQVKVWRPEGFEGLEANRSDAVTSPFQKQYLEDYLFAVGLRGVSEITYRGERTTFSYVPRQGVFQQHQPGETLASRPLNGQGFTFRFLRVSPTQLQTLLGTDEALPYFPELLTDDTQLNGVLAVSFLSLFRTLEGDASRLERESLLLATFGQIIEHCAEAPPSERRLGQEHRAVGLVKDYLQDNYGSDITLSDLSRLVGLNKYHLLEVFERDTHISPHGYLTSVRVARAKDLLARGTPIAQAALEVGLSDQSHLSRLFKKYVLVTPGQYRRDSIPPQDCPRYKF